MPEPFEQLGMFEYDGKGVPRPRRDLLLVPPKKPKGQRHSKTSMDAARLMESERATKLAQIYTFLLDLLPDGMTDEEGQEELGMSGNTYRPRRIELQEMGLVEDSRVTRLTRSRRDAVVWRAVPLQDRQP